MRITVEFFVLDSTHPGSFRFDTLQKDSSDKQVVGGASVEDISDAFFENIRNSPIENIGNYVLRRGTSNQPAVGESDDVFVLIFCLMLEWTYSDTRIIKEPAMVITAQRTVRMVTMMVHIVSGSASLKNNKNPLEKFQTRKT